MGGALSIPPGPPSASLGGRDLLRDRLHRRRRLERRRVDVVEGDGVDRLLDLHSGDLERGLARYLRATAEVLVVGEGDLDLRLAHRTRLHALDPEQQAAVL